MVLIFSSYSHKESKQQLSGYFLIGFEEAALSSETCGLHEFVSRFILLWFHWSTFGSSSWMNGSIIFWEQQWVNRSSSHSVALSASLTVCSPRVVGGGLRRWDLKVAAAAWLLLLCFDVFVDLELGFVGVLDGSVLQFSEEQNQTSDSLENDTNHNESTDISRNNLRNVCARVWVKLSVCCPPLLWWNEGSCLTTASWRFQCYLHLKVNYVVQGSFAPLSVKSAVQASASKSCWPKHSFNTIFTLWQGKKICSNKYILPCRAEFREGEEVCGF